MAELNLQLKIVTPERLVLEQSVRQVSVPTQSGEITILPHHLPLVSALQPGELRLVKSGDKNESVSLAVSGGFVEITGDTVTILADTAEHADEIDETRAEAARQRAQKLLAEVKAKDAVANPQLTGQMQKELARLQVARKRRRGGPLTS
jgi:F-type H+-transporting ATPase subunit epsilon